MQEGRYKLTELVARGRQGRTYAAVDMHEGIEVTISVMNEEFAEQSIAAHALLRNVSGVLRLIDSFTIQMNGGMQKALVFESTRRSYLTSSVTNTLSSTMNEASVAYILQRLLVIIVDVHAAGIIHFNIRASSLLISMEGDIKLTNFRNAERKSKYVKSNTTPTRQPSIGSPPTSPASDGNKPFMPSKHYNPSPWYAPECREGEVAPTTAVDIWCVGITALELSVGVLPQDGQMSGLYAFVEGPGTVYGGKAFSPELKDFIMKCLRRDPGERESAQALLCHPLLSLHSVGLKEDSSSTHGSDRKVRPRADFAISGSGEASYAVDGDRDAPGLDFDVYLESLPDGAGLLNNENADSNNQTSVAKKERTWSSDSASSAVSTVHGGSTHYSGISVCPKALLKMVRKRHSIEKLFRKIKKLKPAKQARGNSSGAAAVSGALAPSAGASRFSSSYDSDSVNTLIHSETEGEDEILDVASPFRRATIPGSGNKPRSPPPRSGHYNPVPAATPPGMMRLTSGGASVIRQGSPGLHSSLSGSGHGSADFGAMGIKPRLGKSGSSNKLPGMVYIGEDGDRDASFAELNYLKPASNQGSGHQGDSSLGLGHSGSFSRLVQHSAGNPLQRLGTPLSPLADINTDPNLPLELYPPLPALAAEAESSLPRGVGHLRVPGLLSTDALIRASGLAQYGELRPTPSRELEVDLSDNQGDRGVHEEDSEQWAVLAAQRNALKNTAAASSAAASQPASQPRGFIKGSKRDIKSSSSDSDGNTRQPRGKGSSRLRPGKSRPPGEHDQKHAAAGGADEGAVSSGGGLGKDAEGASISHRGGPRRHKAAREIKSDLEVSSSATTTSKSGPDSGKRSSSTSKMLSKLMPFQSVLEVVKQHSSSSTKLPEQLSEVFDDILRPSLRELVHSVAKEMDASASAATDADAGDTAGPHSVGGIAPILLEASSKAAGVDSSGAVAEEGERKQLHSLGEKLEQMFTKTDATLVGSILDEKEEKSGKIIKDLMMVLVTTLTALDVISDGNLTKGLLQSLIVKSLEQSLEI